MSTSTIESYFNVSPGSIGFNVCQYRGDGVSPTHPEAPPAAYWSDYSRNPHVLSANGLVLENLPGDLIKCKLHGRTWTWDIRQKSYQIWNIVDFTQRINCGKKKDLVRDDLLQIEAFQLTKMVDTQVNMWALNKIISEKNNSQNTLSCWQAAIACIVRIITLGCCKLYQKKDKIPEIISPNLLAIEGTFCNVLSSTRGNSIDLISNLRFTELAPAGDDPVQRAGQCIYLSWSQGISIEKLFSINVEKFDWDSLRKGETLDDILKTYYENLLKHDPDTIFGPHFLRSHLLKGAS